MQGSTTGVGKWWGMPPLEVTEPFCGSYEGLWENNHLFRIYGSPDGTDIVTVSPDGITQSLAARESQKALFGGADWQAKIRLPAMPETR